MKPIIFFIANMTLQGIKPPQETKPFKSYHKSENGPIWFYCKYDLNSTMYKTTLENETC